MCIFGVEVRRLTHVACPGIQEKHCSLGNDDAFVGNVPDRSARKSQAKHGEVTLVC
jgi:hypothetical protein